MDEAECKTRCHIPETWIIFTQSHFYFVDSFGSTITELISRNLATPMQVKHGVPDFCHSSLAGGSHV